jgi:hypothetical protein
VTAVFGLGLQDEGFDVYTYNDPLEALPQFRPNFYYYGDHGMRKRGAHAIEKLM